MKMPIKNFPRELSGGAAASTRNPTTTITKRSLFLEATISAVFKEEAVMVASLRLENAFSMTMAFSEVALVVASFMLDIPFSMAMAFTEVAFSTMSLMWLGTRRLLGCKLVIIFMRLGTVLQMWLVPGRIACIMICAKACGEGRTNIGMRGCPDNGAVCVMLLMSNRGEEDSIHTVQ